MVTIFNPARGPSVAAAVLVLLIILFARPARGADGPECRVRVALALAAPAGPCDCDVTGECRCRPGGCSCCERPLPEYPIQRVRALADGKVLVTWFGCERPTCCDGALSCRADAQPGTAARVEISFPDGGRLMVCRVLSDRPSPSELADAVGYAAAKLEEARPRRRPPPAAKKPAAKDDRMVYGYAEGLEVSKVSGKPLVTYVGSWYPEAVGGGAVTCQAPAGLPGLPRCVKVSIYHDGRHLGLTADHAKLLDAGYVQGLADRIRAWKPVPALKATPFGPAGGYYAPPLVGGCQGGACCPPR